MPSAALESCSGSKASFTSLSDEDLFENCPVRAAIRCGPAKFYPVVDKLGGSDIRVEAQIKLAGKRIPDGRRLSCNSAIYRFLFGENI